MPPERINTKPNPDLANIEISAIGMKDAKRLIVQHHYMHTSPQGAKIAFGIFLDGLCLGVVIFGYSSATAAKIEKLVPDLPRNQYLEMQRMWISDKLGHNTESYCLAEVMRQLKGINVKLVVTHAGGCKNDCGIVYQAAAWLYFGRDKCDDFYLTTTGEYKNSCAALRFGRISAKGKTKQDIGHELFGPGEAIKSWRYKYVYPLDRGLRRKLAKLSLPYPKDSENYRYNQQWIRG